MTITELKKILVKTRDQILLARSATRKAIEDNSEHDLEFNDLYEYLVDVHRELEERVWNLEDLEEEDLENLA